MKIKDIELEDFDKKDDPYDVDTRVVKEMMRWFNHNEISDWDEFKDYCMSSNAPIIFTLPRCTIERCIEKTRERIKNEK